jgi:hypothetical protein
MMNQKIPRRINNFRNFCKELSDILIYPRHSPPLLARFADFAVWTAIPCLASSKEQRQASTLTIKVKY